MFQRCQEMEVLLDRADGAVAPGELFQALVLVRAEEEQEVGIYLAVVLLAVATQSAQHARRPAQFMATFFCFR